MFSRILLLQVLAALAFFSFGSCLIASDTNQNVATTSRLNKIKSMYAFEGFVYALDVSVSILTCLLI